MSITQNSHSKINKPNKHTRFYEGLNIIQSGIIGEETINNFFNINVFTKQIHSSCSLATRTSEE